MKRTRQTFEEIVTSLIPIEASWLDAHAEEVITKSMANQLKADLQSLKLSHRL